MAQNFLDSDRRDFWHEFKEVRGGSVTCPTSLDGVQGELNITNLFADKYQHLYNSVSYNSEHMSLLKRDIDDKIVHSHSECKSHLINAQDVINMVKELKLNKHDGNKGHYSNHITNGTHRLHCSISLLFNSMISHGFVPNDLLLSTIIPIPKNKRKSLSKSDNFRAIALSSIMGKLLDKILLNKCHNIFKTSMYQYGFKKSHSTSHCTFVVNETIQYYINNKSNVFVTLLDASRAFDRVEYVQLFKSLMSKGICPVIARFLVFMHTNQNIRIKWGNTYVTFGVYRFRALILMVVRLCVLLMMCHFEVVMTTRE